MNLLCRLTEIPEITGLQGELIATVDQSSQNVASQDINVTSRKPNVYEVKLDKQLPHPVKIRLVYIITAPLKGRIMEKSAYEINSECSSLGHFTFCRITDSAGSI